MAPPDPRAGCLACLHGRPRYAAASATPKRLALLRAAGVVRACSLADGAEFVHITPHGYRRPPAELNAIRRSFQMPTCPLCRASLDPREDVLSVRADDLARTGIDVPLGAVRQCEDDPQGLVKHVVDPAVADAIETALGWSELVAR